MNPKNTNFYHKSLNVDSFQIALYSLFLSQSKVDLSVLGNLSHDGWYLIGEDFVSAIRVALPSVYPSLVSLFLSPVWPLSWVLGPDLISKLQG